jgi:hypothetical protein
LDHFWLNGIKAQMVPFKMNISPHAPHCYRFRSSSPKQFVVSAMLWEEKCGRPKAVLQAFLALYAIVAFWSAFCLFYSTLIVVSGTPAYTF